MKKLVSILLAALLVCGAFGCVAIRMFNKYENADRYQYGAFTYEAASVYTVDLDWAAGDVTVKHGSGTLSVSESGGETLSVSERLHWWLDGTTLRIKYCESGYSHVIPSKDKLFAALAIVGGRHKINEVRDYLFGLKWDGVKRLDTILTDYLAAEDNAYTRAVARKSLVAAVARAVDGGVKYDYMPILVGPQGVGKSTFLATLGRQWFSDSLTTFEG